MTTRRLAPALCVLLAGLLVAATPPVEAARTVVHVTNGTLQQFPTPGRHVLVLDGATGAQTVTFPAKKNGPVLIMFTAECAVVPGGSGYVLVSIEVDGAAVPPTDSDMALCNTVNPQVQIGSTTVQTVVVPGKGSHELQIAVRLEGGTGTVWIDDISLTILGLK